MHNYCADWHRNKFLFYLMDTSLWLFFVVAFHEATQKSSSTQILNHNTTFQGIKTL